MAPETFTTLLTLMCFFSRVYFLVFGQMIVPNEGFSTFLTLVAFIVMMHSEVKSVGAPMSETLTTDTAKVGLLPAVYSQVFFQSCSFTHGFPTDEAGPFSLSTVGALDVAFPVPGVVKLPATYVTGKRAQVVLLVVLKPRKSGLEVVVAVSTLERPGLRVKDHVLFQVWPPRKGLVADITFPSFTLPLLD